MVKKKIYVYSTEYVGETGERANTEVLTFGAFPKKQDIVKTTGEKVSRIISAMCIKIHDVEMSADEFLEAGTIVKTEE